MNYQLNLDGLRDRLRELRAEQLRWPKTGILTLVPELDEYFLRHELVTITLGMGPAMYLSLDGRVIIWNYDDGESPCEANDPHDIAAGVALAVERWSMPELLPLLPTRPADGHECPTCGGERWLRHSAGRWVRFSEGPANAVQAVCRICCGLGWTTNRRSRFRKGA